MKKLLLSLGLLLFLSLSLTGCNDDNAKAQGDVEDELDFLIDVISGSVLEDPEGDSFILELEVSPTLVFIAERPSVDSGTLTTGFFLEEFDEIFSDDPPNAILTFRDEEGLAVAVPVKLNSVVFDRELSVAEFRVTPLVEFTGENPIGTSVELNGLTDIPPEFGRAFLFIDSVSSFLCELCCANALAYLCIPIEIINPESVLGCVAKICPLCKNKGLALCLN